MTAEDDALGFSPSSTDEDLDLSAGYAFLELHHGRIEWLAKHIKQSNFRIDPFVARKILALIERTESYLHYELRIVRRSDIPAARKERWQIDARNFEIAKEVARRGGFDRGMRERVCHDIGPAFGLNSWEYVWRCVRPFREQALASILDEEALAAEP